MKTVRHQPTSNVAVASTGGALFIDILGIGELTRGNIPISVDTVSAITDLSSVPQESINHYLAVYLQTSFRNILATVKNACPSINIAQLSDCAFLWCADLDVLTEASSKLMFGLTKKGILCRGGLGYGEILTPYNDGNESLGKFVMGSAVTNAATYEKLGKGCRIFTSPDFALEFGNLHSKSIFYPFLFHPHTIPTDYTYLDEYRWYLLPTLDILNGTVIFPFEMAKEAMLQSADLVCTLFHSPLMKWNVANEHGCRHIAASIEAITSGMSHATNPHDRRGHNLNDFCMSAEIVIEAIRERDDALYSRRYESFKRVINEINFNNLYPV